MKRTAQLQTWLYRIRDARDRIAQLPLPTRLLQLDGLSKMAGRPILGKYEIVLPTGSFKVRGALNAIRANHGNSAHRPIVAASTGNHGRALAWAAGENGDCTVHVSRLTPPDKLDALRREGARLVVTGDSYDEAELAARQQAASAGALFVPPFSHPDVIAGQGTIGLELAEQLDALDIEKATIVVPVSGGGLAGGIAAALASLRPQDRVRGVSMDQGAAMHASLAAGRPTAVSEFPSLADSLGGGVGGEDSLTFPLVRDTLASLDLVTEQQIGAAMVAAWRQDALQLEGAAAAALALALDPRAQHWHDPLVVILSGRNVPLATIEQLERAMAA